jgi:dipeptidyl aminopeptidase/acylaminoacyl peptidase
VKRFLSFLISFILVLLPVTLTAQTPQQSLGIGDKVKAKLEKGEVRRYLLNIKAADLPVDIVMYSSANSVLTAYDEKGGQLKRVDRMTEYGNEVVTVMQGDPIPAAVEAAFSPDSPAAEFELGVLPSEQPVTEEAKAGEQVKRWADLEVGKTGSTKHVVLPYLLYVPQDYDAAQKYPFILFLHGAGEAGPRLDFLKRQVIPKLIEEGQDYPFIIASPHLDYYEDWSTKADVLAAFITYLQTEFPIDPKRIDVTGLSLGGAGAWHFAVAHPDVPAAVVSMAGFYTYGHAAVPKEICNLSKIPMWVVHGAQDQTVELQWEQALVDAVKKCGGNVRFTIYPDADHAQTFEQGFADPALYTWLLEQHK